MCIAAFRIHLRWYDRLMRNQISFICDDGGIDGADYDCYLAYSDQLSEASHYSVASMAWLVRSDQPRAGLQWDSKCLVGLPRHPDGKRGALT